MVKRAEAKNITLNFDPAPTIPVTYLDINQIVQVISCLIQNAIKFTNEGGRVRVFCEARDENLITHVEDNGLGLEEGDAHVIRNAGGVVTDDVIRSLAISQRLLGTEEIVLIHHTDCGMLTFNDDAVKADIEAETGLRPSFALEAFSDLESDVRQSIRRIQASPFVPRKDRIRGFVYDVDTGRLAEVEA